MLSISTTLQWLGLVGIIWLQFQSINGTNTNLPAYSSQLKELLPISQVQLNSLSLASDAGKFFGWFSGLAALYLPLWLVLIIGSTLRLISYGRSAKIYTNIDELRNCKFLNIYASRELQNGKQIMLKMEKRIFNCEYEEYIGRDEVFQLVKHEQLGASIICAYIRCLFDHNVKNGLGKKFAFLNPHWTTSLVDDQVHYIAKALEENEHPDQLYLAPYNTGGHWVLIVINATKGSIFYLDPLHGDLTHRTTMKETFDIAMRVYHDTCGKKLKWSRCNWNIIKCPRQTNYIDCGYYVLCFMREIILHKQTSIPDKYFVDCQVNFYSKSYLNGVIEELATYLVDDQLKKTS